MDPRVNRLKFPGQTAPPKKPPARQFTEADLRMQRSILLHGGDWDTQYAIPARPWSPQTERHCEDTRRQAEYEDWQASQARRNTEG
jgi:hypothetical protein